MAVVFQGSVYRSIAEPQMPPRYDGEMPEHEHHRVWSATSDGLVESEAHPSPPDLADSYARWGEDWFTKLTPEQFALYTDQGGQSSRYSSSQPQADKYKVQVTSPDSELADPLDAGNLKDLLESKSASNARLTGGISFEDFLSQAEDKAVFDAALDDGIRLLQARDAKETVGRSAAAEGQRQRLRTERIAERRAQRQVRREAAKETLRKVFNQRVGAVVLTAALAAGAVFQAISPSEKVRAESRLAAQTAGVELVIDEQPLTPSEQAIATTSVPAHTIPLQEIAQQVIEENAKRAAATTTTSTTTPPLRAAQTLSSVEAPSTVSEGLTASGEINGTSWERIQTMYNYLRQTHELSQKGAAYFIGNIMQEAGPGMKPDAYNPREDAYGFIQAQGGREAGIPLHDTYEQLDWLLDIEAPRDGGSPRLKAILSDPGASDAQIKQAIFNWIRWGDTGKRWIYAGQILQTLA